MGLPARCDVAVLGGGLGGLLTAEALARSGASVVLLEGAPGPAAASDRSLGIVGLGWLDSPWRLTRGLGERTARGLLAWSALAMKSLAATSARLGAPIRPTGSWRVSLDEGEALEWIESARLLESWGLSEPRPAAPDELPSIAQGLHGALFLPGDGLLDVAGLLTALRASLDAAGGVRIAQGAATLDERHGAPVVRVGKRVLLCELAVVAAGVGAPTAHPFFRSCVYPVRVQAQRVTLHEVPDGPPVIARHRFEAWCRESASSLCFVGSRWAEQPEMEAGVSDDARCSDRVSARQEEFLSDRLGVPRDAPRDRWSGIASYTCDGLPLVGPLPGEPRVIALTGWSGWGLGLIGRAVDEITAAILGEPAPDGAGTPSWLQARRLV